MTYNKNQSLFCFCFQAIHCKLSNPRVQGVGGGIHLGRPEGELQPNQRTLDSHLKTRPIRTQVMLGLSSRVDLRAWVGRCASACILNLVVFLTPHPLKSINWKKKKPPSRLSMKEFMAAHFHGIPFLHLGMLGLAVLQQR